MKPGRRILHAILPCLLLSASASTHAQTAFGGSFGEFGGGSNYEQNESTRGAEGSAARGALDRGIGVTGWGLTTVGSASDFLDSWSALGNTDGLCTLTDPGPQIPSSCGEPDSECYTCYERATNALNFNRSNLHRAWCITHTNLAMARSAIAFGDSSSGIHAVTGLSWSLGGKPQVEEAVRHLRGTYDRKQREFIASIDGNLKALGKCEEEHFDERDWYTRFGYMYLDHLRVRYKTADP